MKRILISSLLVIFCLTNTAWAQDSFSVSVSCIIPAVPGVNAPLIGEKAVIQEENKTASPLLIQEEKEIKLAEEKNSSIILQTLYSR